nr:hypothetical protein Iba_chr08cCG1900 [Ipomoea batatas]
MQSSGNIGLKNSAGDYLATLLVLRETADDMAHLHFAGVAVRSFKRSGGSGDLYCLTSAFILRLVEWLRKEGGGGGAGWAVLPFTERLADVLKAREPNSEREFSKRIHQEVHRQLVVLGVCLGGVLALLEGSHRLSSVLAEGSRRRRTARPPAKAL